MNKVSRAIIGLLVVIILAGIGFGAYTNYINNPRHNTPLVYSNSTMLYELWKTYKEGNIEATSHRTLDKDQDNITTSEGESYTMLRAVWSDDRTTFDQSWKWTKDNLRRDDSLMSWKFGKNPDGSYGVQKTIGGENTASDGDSDIALSLLMAYSRWNEPGYLYDAKPILGNMWDKEVVTIKGKPILVSNDLERNNKDTVIVNPSYLSPYAYKIFAKADPAHDWTALANNSYDILNEVSDLKLDTNSSVGLPPDWVNINRQTGEITRAIAPNLTSNFSYDAIRTPFRLALDWNWFKDERAKALLAKYSFLNDQWQANGKLNAGYTHDGKVVGDYESIATYGATIGYFVVEHPDTAKEIYQQKLVSLYTPDQQRWKKQLSYYDDNWAWFGMALVQDKLPNLTGVK